MKLCTKCGANPQVEPVPCCEGPCEHEAFNDWNHTDELCEDCMIAAHYEELEHEALFLEFMCIVFGPSDWQTKLLEESMKP